MLGGIAGLVGLSAVAGVLVTATVTPAIAVSGAAASSAITVFDNMPSYLEIGEPMLPTTIYTNHGEAGWQELTRFYDQNRTPVAFDQISPVMYDAILSSEDPRYYQHGGIDLLGTTRALISNARGNPTQGGSSISQQYVKNVLIQRCEQEATDEIAEDGTVTRTRDEVLQSCWMEATNASGVEGYQRKLQEMRYAIALEQRYSKNDILLEYLNIANFGGTTYGIEAAARYYFNTTAAQLTVGQAATLAGIVQNPNVYRIDQPGNEANGDANGYARTKQRQSYVLGRMLEDGKITREQYDQAMAEPITPAITRPETGCGATEAAAYFCQYVVYTVRNDPAFGETAEQRERALKRGGLNIYTTLDWRLQDAAQNAMSDYAPSSVPGMRFGSAVVSVEATTGRVLAIAQNTMFSEDGDVLANDPNYSALVYAGDRTFGQSVGFQAGSTFKLFTLIDWLEQGRSVNEVLNGSLRVFPRMTNSCEGDWINYGRDLVHNFGRVGGYTGTPMRFTADSLNTGYLAMAEQLDMCDIAEVANRMGVTRGDGAKIRMNVATSVIGIDNVSPLAMAAAYATVANNGIYCQPQVIERVTDHDGNELPRPERTCNQVISPEVAATAAFALEGVMTGGTGRQANPGGGVPVLGKTGTHEAEQSWMIESSTKVATAAWAGNTDGGKTSIFERRYNGRALSDIRYPIARDVQRAANDAYGGDPFPRPDGNLTRQVMRDVPSVVGQTVEQAESTLRDAGFNVNVGDPVDSDQPANIVASQSATSAPAGSTITINPSNGQATAVPAVSGNPNQARQQLQSAGFGNVALGSCTESPNAPPEGAVSGTEPAAGTVANRNTPIALHVSARTCP